MPAQPFFLFDTATKIIKQLIPSDGKTIRIYACGPTVYNHAHIGNFRTFLFEDLLRRTLLLLGHNIHHVMNITDVDDKTIKGAIASNMTLSEYTNKYTEIFFQDLQLLRIQPIEEYPKATDYIPQMIQMIETLIQKNHAYLATDGSVYYKISSCTNYGKLSHLHVEELQLGASGRITSDEYSKEGLSDFVLWKAYDPKRDDTIFWQAPWGKGRPGWHIECSVMAKELLGNTIDLHLGGVDLIFPHHENEIAQSEAANGCCFSNHWAHAEHLLVDSKKMSKSLNNFHTLESILTQGFSPEALRFFLLSAHYRTQLNFTFEALKASEISLKRLRDCYNRLREVEKSITTSAPQGEYLQAIQSTEHNFVQALSNDLNISEALSFMFELVRLLNHALDLNLLSHETITKAIQFFELFDSILDILQPGRTNNEIPQEITDLLTAREEARATRRWDESDRLRSELLSKGYSIEDTKNGQKLSKAIPHVSTVDYKR